MHVNDTATLSLYSPDDVNMTDAPIFEGDFDNVANRLVPGVYYGTMTDTTDATHHGRVIVGGPMGPAVWVCANDCGCDD